MGPAAPLGVTAALTVTLGVACFAVILAGVEVIYNPQPLPPPFDLGRHQSAETGLYLAAFVIVLPGALTLGPRLADDIATGPNGAMLSPLAAVLAGSLVVAVTVANLVPAGGGAELLVAMAIWWLGALLLLARIRRTYALPALSIGAAAAPWLWALTGALVLLGLLAFTAVQSITLLVVAVGGILMAAVLILYWRGGRAGTTPLPRRIGALLDGGIVAVIILAALDLVVFSRDTPLDAFKATVARSHQNYLLGPANEVLHGGAVLVDAASQYGIGPIYALAGWFQLVPPGYGMVGLLDGLLFGLSLAAGFVLLRMASVSRVLAAGSMALALVVLIYNLLYSVGSLPQHGPLRFGLPLALTLAATADVRWPRHSRAALALQLLVLGLSSVWSFESFAFTAITYAGISSFWAWTREPPSGVALVCRAAVGVGACVAAQMLFIAGTLAGSGEVPDYGWYFAFLQAFLVDDVGNITYDFSPWSAGLAVGVGYATLAAVLVLLVLRRPDIAQRDRVATIALAGTTAYGIALFYYFIDRSMDDILPYVSLPLLLAGTIWLSLLLRGALGGSRDMRLGGLAFALSLSLLLVATAWSSVGGRFERTALGHILPGGRSAIHALERLWDLPPIDNRAVQGEQLLARYMPGQDRVLSIVWPDLEAEILLRSGRAHRLPISFPPEDSFVSSEYLPELGHAVAELKPGDRILMEPTGLVAFADLQRPDAPDPLGGLAAPHRNMSPLQDWVLQSIGERFDLAVIHRDRQGFVIAQLVRRRAAGRS